ncbi:hypothetical protein [Brachyspira hampsonii]|uniref:Outer membrane protein beta-barrel domain-containing protein n=2 Tax=Brachyspira hampsonii TaxID=1287055 RepID=A0AAC9TT95_9SPIR|nr:hypothetical protein [Brachyspira hampsonii]ASJ20827.1 hypothetical protein BHAMNSH16_03860 [Brachyspira hampsonii]ELV04495.1 hypothetical protein H263_15886 [Brachyspira hampsonii 30599]MBW5410764.1 hypothetical protein [Brachyspira hampsonii]OEJ18974.1 hypothetical protein A9496_06095 [Brachyspira hampsonii]
MKHLKKIIFTAVLAAALSTSAFAASGFEFILNVPLGMSISIDNYYSSHISSSGTVNQSANVLYKTPAGLGFDTGVSAQVGYMWQVLNNFGISLLGEIGYSFDSSFGQYSFDQANVTDGFKVPGAKDEDTASTLVGRYPDGFKISTYTHNLKIGILPKFNINAFSIGIGGGIIVPMAVSMYGELNGESGKMGGDNAKYKIVNPVGFYGKITFDYSIFFTDKIAMNIGLYTGVDMVSGTEITLEEGSIAGQTVRRYDSSMLFTYDIGLQVGFRFGPKAFN